MLHKALRVLSWFQAWLSVKGCHILAKLLVILGCSQNLIVSPCRPQHLPPDPDQSEVATAIGCSAPYFECSPFSGIYKLIHGACKKSIIISKHDDPFDPSLWNIVKPGNF